MKKTEVRTSHLLCFEEISIISEELNEIKMNTMKNVDHITIIKEKNKEIEKRVETIKNKYRENMNKIGKMLKIADLSDAVNNYNSKYMCYFDNNTKSFNVVDIISQKVKNIP